MLKDMPFLMDPNDIEKRRRNGKFTTPFNERDTSNEETTNSRRYFENTVNRLVEEEQEYNMVCKVFICSKCEAGTSYCADKLKRKDGRWVCNYCETTNNSEENQYYLYNKLESSIIAHLENPDDKDDIMRPNIKVKNCDRKKPSQYRTDLLDKDKDSYEVRDIYNNTFIANHKSQKFIKKKFKSKENTRDESNYYDSATLNMMLGCSEIKVSDSQTFYVFYTKYADFQEEEEEGMFFDKTHRLAILPKISNGFKSNKFQMDELLVVMFDDLNRLTVHGVDISTPYKPNHIVKINIINFTATHN
ncbi:hypothetical protein WICPIJ_009674 [Wickerhamomyces pijperi]|uniref:Uncharacterized protein n=1 Tax=Wickerhamomyces pijperi TaxID=599730 RepID=A0A9P8PKD5_WICPI|nr:hypothetical protein WICPIJ_009674 [Wickerhamomyces pijperi]